MTRFQPSPGERVMGAAKPAVDSASVVQSLVYTLLDVFDATRDLYVTLKNKEARDREKNLKSKGYVDLRKPLYIDNENVGDEGIVLDKAAVNRQYEIGVDEIGSLFAVGDVISQTALQSQIIVLQSVIIATFLYGPTSPEPISQQLSELLRASRAAGTTSVDVLTAQLSRQRSNRPIEVPTQPVPPYPVTAVSSFSDVPARSIAMPANDRPQVYPAKTTIMSVVDRPEISRTDTESTSFTGNYPENATSTPQNFYCLYAMDLQRDPVQKLSSTIEQSSSPYCPYCRRILHLHPSKSWEIFKSNDGVEHCFRIQNRFVVKCHRNSVDGGYSCVFCSKKGDMAVCGDVKALVRHVWMDHDLKELHAEEDIYEIVENIGRRRDSLMSFSESKGSSERRSASVGPARERSRRSLPR